MAYLGYLGLKGKAKVTSFQSTFKVKQNKVPLFFHLKAKHSLYEPFLGFHGCENGVKGCELELATMCIFRSTHLLPQY